MGARGSRRRRGNGGLRLVLNRRLQLGRSISGWCIMGRLRARPWRRRSIMRRARGLPRCVVILRCYTTSPDRQSQTGGLPDEQLDDDASTLHDPEDPPRDSEPDDASEELSIAQATFADTFSSMNEGRKWVLASGRAVETVVFEACQAMDADTFTKSIARSFVIDLSDATMESWFSEDEWKEIQRAIIPLPDPDVVLLESMRRFFLVRCPHHPLGASADRPAQVKTTDELQEVLMTTSFLPKDASYSRDTHFNSSWADLVIRKQYVCPTPIQPTHSHPQTHAIRSTQRAPPRKPHGRLVHLPPLVPNNRQLPPRPPHHDPRAQRIPLSRNQLPQEPQPH